ncbi:MAG: circadian clock KaiB family protein [Dehalococcoidia bacterium]|nr:circadian clock KaiB family protein [Dehalococcoidia bacterium]
MAVRYAFKLYIAGNTARSQHAIATLRAICATKLGGQCLLTIVDILEQPEEAEAARILATPTLVREQPLPTIRLTGDLSNLEAVYQRLRLALAPEPTVSGPTTEFAS